MVAYSYLTRIMEGLPVTRDLSSKCQEWPRLWKSNSLATNAPAERLSREIVYLKLGHFVTL